MKACRKATNSSSKLIATLPDDDERPTPRPRPVLFAPAAMMKDSSTASRMWPGDHVGEQSNGEREHFRDQADDLDRDQQRRHPDRTGTEMREVRLAAEPQAVDDHHHHRDDGQRRGHPDVARGGAAEVRAEQVRHHRNRQQAEDVDGQHEEEDAPDVLDEAIGVLVQRRLGDFLAQVVADRLEPVGRAGRHHRVDAGPAAPALHQHRHQRDQQQAGQRRSSRSDRKRA